MGRGEWPVGIKGLEEKGLEIWRQQGQTRRSMWMDI